MKEQVHSDGETSACVLAWGLSDLRAVLQYRFILSSEPFSLFLNELLPGLGHSSTLGL